jgi:DNA invertase Pin-like site-specific DNA recombinase/cell fate (sporulation/competence/biofilm development) regulator YmcA (YheA/YmcA/DUF963 family)
MEQKKKKAYLYSRVSKTKQATEGKGLQRQQDLALEFLAQYPEYEIADIFEDAGVSAFYPKNLKKDAGLGGFLQVCAEGKIEPDSMLVVESVDRLSRLGIDHGQVVFTKLKMFKINVAITKFNLVIYWDDKNNLGNSIQIVSGLYVGHLESEQKSKRILKSFDYQLEATRKGERLFRTGTRPSWLEVSEDGKKFICPEENAALIRLIFRLKLVDKFGIRRIIQFLDKNGIKTFTGRKWSYTILNKLLRNKAVTGTFQPTRRHTGENGERINVPNGDEITDYYPRIIEDKVFQAVQDGFSHFTKADRLQGRKNGYSNLFRHLTTCRKCGSPFISKTQYLVCNDHMKVGCSNRYIIYKNIEEQLLKFFKSTAFLSHFTKINEQPSNMAQYEEEYAQLDTTHKNLEKTLEMFDNPEDLQRIVNRINEISKQKVSLRHMMEEQALKDSSNLYQEIQKEYELTNEFNREKYNGILRASLEYIQFFDGYAFIRIQGLDYDLVLHQHLPNLILKREYPSINKKETIMLNPEVLRDMGVPEAEIERKLKSSAVPNSDQEFFEHHQFTIDTHIAESIYEEQIREGLTKKQTTRKIRDKKLCLSAEDKERIKENINLEERLAEAEVLRNK